MIKENSSFEDFFSSTNFNDEFGYNKVWNREINKWLEVYKIVSPKYYYHNKNEIIKSPSKEKRRDSFLGEAKSIYFLHKIKNMLDPQIEPIGPSFDIGFTHKNIKYLAEIKTPGLGKEMVKNDENITKDEKARISQPKHIDSEAFTTSPKDFIVKPIQQCMSKINKNLVKAKSYKKILIICPNQRISPSQYPKDILRNEVLTTLKEIDPNRQISHVCILEALLYTGNNNVNYKSWCFSQSEKTSLF